MEKIATRGYKNCQPNVLDWLEGKGYPRATDKNALTEQTLEEKYGLLAKWMLVKEDKPNSCYHFARLLENLKKMPAEEFALAIRGKPDDLNCEFAYDLLFIAQTRFKSINSFRTLVYDKFTNAPDAEGKKELEDIKQSAIILLDPIKEISSHKFVYSLTECPRNPARK